MSAPNLNHAQITVGIVSNNYLVRIGIQSALTSQPHVRVIGEASGTLEAEALALRTHPDVLVMEIEPHIDIRQLGRTLKSSVPATRIILLIGIEEPLYEAGSVSSGIDGIVLSIQPPVVLLATINYICSLPAATTKYEPSRNGRLKDGESTGGDDASRYLSTDYLDTSLTGREREIVQLIGQALSNKDIAERLCISSITVRHHLTSIFGKFDVHNRQQLLLRAYEYGLLRPVGTAPLTQTQRFHNTVSFDRLRPEVNHACGIESVIPPTAES